MYLCLSAGLLKKRCISFPQCLTNYHKISSIKQGPLLNVSQGWNPGAGGDQALACWSRVHLQTPSCWLSSIPVAAGLQFPFPWLPAGASQLKRHFSSCGCPHLKPAMVSQVLLLWISDFCWQPEKTQGPHELVSCSQIISLLLYNLIMDNTHRFTYTQNLQSHWGSSTEVWLLQIHTAIN